jgi:UDP-N-acetylglucosamine 4-epimerase
MPDPTTPSPYHAGPLGAYRFLVTGGAGFIGSNIVDHLMDHGAGSVRVLDNLATGSLDNLRRHLDDGRFEFIHGDIRDLDTCRKAVDSMTHVSHQAALGSVPRSIQDPITSNEVNVTGFLNMLVAVRDSPLRPRMVYAASSSTYGDSPTLPKREGEEGNPLSPYAITKAVNEHYARVFSSIYGIHTVGLRYFNVFGPKQSPDNPYAAVIPLFCRAYLRGEAPRIFGDGETSRDFTYVENAVQANIRGMLIPTLESHAVANVACGEQWTLKAMAEEIRQICGSSIQPVHAAERPGDVKHSKADITRIRTLLGYEPVVTFKEGIRRTLEWNRSHLSDERPA